MKNKWITLQIGLVCICIQLLRSGEAYAQKPDLFYKAFVENDIGSWQKELSALATSSLSPDEELLYMEGLYGYIGWCIRDGREKEGRKYLYQMQKCLHEFSLPPFYQNLYQSVAIGFGILLNTESPVMSGPKSIRLVNKAIRQDAGSPLGYLQKGNVLLKMPRVFGGSATKALEYFGKAEQLMEKDARWQKSWIYLHLLCLMSEIYTSNNESQKAHTYYQKVKTKEPALFWLSETGKR